MFGWKNKKTKEEQANRRERIARRNAERAAQRLAERDQARSLEQEEEKRVSPLKKEQYAAQDFDKQPAQGTQRTVHVDGVRGSKRHKKTGSSLPLRKQVPKLRHLLTERLEENRLLRFKKRTQAIAKMTPQMNLKRGAQPASRFSWLSGLSVSMTYDISLDLGTSNVLIYAKGQGLVLNEPSFVARDVVTKEIFAVGKEAKAMWGRTPEGIEVVQPLQAGVISDYDTTEFMLRYFIRLVVPGSALLRTRILACVPSGITPVGKRAILEALLRTGAKKTVLIEEPLAAAMGTGLDEASNIGAMVVDMGGGTTDIAVVCESGVVVSESLQIGGDTFDEAISRIILRKRNLVIGKPTAQAIKISGGTVDRKMAKGDIVVRGRDGSTGLPKAMLIPSTDIQQAIEPHMMAILEGIKNILEKTPPELVASIVDHGILITGGSAYLDGVDRIITRVIGIAAYVVEEPDLAVIRGTAKALQDMSQLQDSLEELQ